MSSFYIGLSCTGHDNAVAIVDPEGRIVFAESAERYLQNKRALGYTAEDHLRIEKLVDEYYRFDGQRIASNRTEPPIGRVSYSSVLPLLANR